MSGASHRHQQHDQESAPESATGGGTSSSSSIPISSTTTTTTNNNNTTSSLANAPRPVLSSSSANTNTSSTGAASASVGGGGGGNTTTTINTTSGNTNSSNINSAGSGSHVSQQQSQPTPSHSHSQPSQQSQNAAVPPFSNALTYQQQLQMVLSRPCVALSASIMLLYKEINNKYCRERRLRAPGPKYNEGYDDKDGHYIAVIGEEIFERYTVQKVLGKGSFGTVLRCFDEKYQEHVAVKIIRSGIYFYNQGALEVDIIMKLNSNPALENLVVRLRKVFMWHNHLVLVFDLHSFNLYQLLGYTRYNGVSLDITRKFAYQLLQVLRNLETHRPPIIHCDLKPENVLLRDENRSIIRLIDFGSACYEVEGQAAVKYIQSRFYRAPEVILELGYTTAIDRWSLGCMLVELHTGVPLFAGHDESDQISRFTGVLGPIPEKMVRASPKRDLFYCEIALLRRDAINQPPHPTGTTTGVDGPTGLSNTSGGGRVSARDEGTSKGRPPSTSSLASQQQRVKGRAGSTTGSRAHGSRGPSATNSSSSTTPSKMKGSGSISRPATTTQNTSSNSNSGGGGGSKAGSPAGGKSSGSGVSQRPRSSHGTPFASASSSGGIGGSSSATNSSNNNNTSSGGGGGGHMTDRTAAATVVPRALPSVSPTRAVPPGSTDLVLRNPPPPHLQSSLRDILGVTTGGPRGFRAGQPGHDVETYAMFYDLVTRLLQYDPAKRISCTDALRHPFLQPLLRELESQCTPAVPVAAAPVGHATAGEEHGINVSGGVSGGSSNNIEGSDATTTTATATTTEGIVEPDINKGEAGDTSSSEPSRIVPPTTTTSTSTSGGGGTDVKSSTSAAESKTTTGASNTAGGTSSSNNSNKNNQQQHHQQHQQQRRSHKSSHNRSHHNQSSSSSTVGSQQNQQQQQQQRHNDPNASSHSQQQQQSKHP